MYKCIHAYTIRCMRKCARQDRAPNTYNSTRQTKLEMRNGKINNSACAVTPCTLCNVYIIYVTYNIHPYKYGTQTHTIHTNGRRFSFINEYKRNVLLFGTSYHFVCKLELQNIFRSIFTFSLLLLLLS